MRNRDSYLEIAAPAAKLWGMINQAIQAILSRLNDYIGTAEPEVVLGNISLIDAFQDTSAQSLTDRVIASVVNIEQEGSLRNIPFRRPSLNQDGLPRVQEREPEIHLNVYLLFGSNKNNYGTALLRISQVIAFFQRKFVFTPADTPELGVLDLNKVVFDLYSTNFTELNQLWGIMGGKYIPSVVYKMRVCIIQDADEVPSAMVEEINLGAANLNKR